MKLKSYKSDGCTGWFDGFWVDCCEDHDKDYWKGGTKKERKLSDKRLRKCVHDRVYLKYNGLAAFVWSNMMYIGVRILGAPWLPLMNARWGFGRPYTWGNLGYGIIKKEI